MKKFIQNLIAFAAGLGMVEFIWYAHNNKPRIDYLAGWFFLIAFTLFFVWHGFKMRLVLGAIDAGLGYLVYAAAARVKDKFVFVFLVVLTVFLLCAALVSLIAILLQ